MSSEDFAIDVQHVTKRFRLTGGTSLKHALIDRFRGRDRHEITALQDVSFQVRHGETLGFIGHNGAGKSTLFSIIAGTMKPTAGSVATHGTISSLLELGAGFHPDLTGRENVMLYGTIMGIPRATMRRRFDDVVDFAGPRVAEFIDQPVRFYSSGMFVRLGFAVAVQVDPDILLVDEVLAVGDADFQRRCLDKMDEFRRAGKSMLLISHDIATIRRVSDRIAYLDHGKLMGLGNPDEIADCYRAAVLRENGHGDIDPDLPLVLLEHRNDWGTHDVEFTEVSFIDPVTGAALAGAVREASDRVALRLHWKAKRRFENSVVGFSIADAETGFRIFGSNTQIEKAGPVTLDGCGSIRLDFDLSNLQGGDYMLSFSMHDAEHKCNYHRLDNHLLLKVDKKRMYDGIVTVPCAWSGVR